MSHDAREPSASHRWCKSVVVAGVCVDFLYVSVCEIDEGLRASVCGEAPTERVYLDDRLAEDVCDVGARPVFGRLTVCIDPAARRRRPRPLACLLAGVLAVFVVSAAVRSRGAHRHRTVAVARRTARARTFHRRRIVVERPRPRHGYRVRRRRARHRGRATAVRVYRGSQDVPAAPAPAPSPPVSVPAARGEEFGFER